MPDIAADILKINEHSIRQPPSGDIAHGVNARRTVIDVGAVFLVIGDIDEMKIGVKVGDGPVHRLSIIPASHHCLPMKV